MKISTGFVLVTLLQFLSLLLVACGSTPQLEAQPYHHQAKGFTIYPPKGWRLRETDGGLRFDHPKSVEQDRFNEISIQAGTIDTNQKLDEYVEKHLTLIQKLPGVPYIKDFELIENRRVTINGQEVHFVRYTMTTSTPGATKLKSRALELIIEGCGKVYLARTTVSEKNWSKYNQILEASLRTFRVC